MASCLNEAHVSQWFQIPSSSGWTYTAGARYEVLTSPSSLAKQISKETGLRCEVRVSGAHREPGETFLETLLHPDF